MQYFAFFATLLAVSPLITHAQGLQLVLTNVLEFLNTVAIPFLLGIGFLFFVFNAIRYFVFQSSSEDGREKAKTLATYSVLGFVLILLFWGIVNIFAGFLGFGGTAQPTSDYIDPNAAESSGIPRSNNGNNPPATYDNGGSSVPGESDGDLCSQGAPFDENGNPCGIY